MSELGEQKIKCSIGLSARVVTAVQREATLRQISFADMVRRITDAWLDEMIRDKDERPARVLVLDRENQRVRAAR